MCSSVGVLLVAAGGGEYVSVLGSLTAVVPL